VCTGSPSVRAFSATAPSSSCSPFGAFYMCRLAACAGSPRARAFSATDSSLSFFPLWGLLCVQACCVCRQPQGACIQCDGPKCLTAYHPTCAMKAGFHLDVVPQMRKDGRAQLVKCTFCPKHRYTYRPLSSGNSVGCAAKSRAQLVKCTFCPKHRYTHRPLWALQSYLHPLGILLDVLPRADCSSSSAPSAPSTGTPTGLLAPLSLKGKAASSIHSYTEAKKPGAAAVLLLYFRCGVAPGAAAVAIVSPQGPIPLVRGLVVGSRGGSRE